VRGNQLKIIYYFTPTRTPGSSPGQALPYSMGREK
jgi:hypothetical protein